MALTGDGPVKSTLDHVVDKLNEMNKDQTALQQEAVLYSNELQEYIQNEGHKLSNAQLQSTNELILALREGRLEDLEEHREELLRNRAEARRDEERNDTLLDQFKQLKKQYKLLQDAFAGKDGMSIIGLIIRTALVGFVIGLVQGFLKPYVAGIKAISGAVSNVASKAYKFFAFDKLFNAIKLGFNNFRVGFVDLFKNSRLAKFFQGVSKESLGARFFNQVKLVFKDFGTLGKNILNFVKALGFAFIGLFTGAPTAFKRLADAKLAFSPKGVVFRLLGGLVNFIKKPFTLVINKIRGAFTGLSFALAGIADKIGGLFSQGGKTTIFTKAANRIKKLFAKQGPLSRFFGFFSQIQGLFRGIGQVVGKLLWPLFALIGFIKGATTEAKKEKDTANKVIRGFIGGIGGAFRILIGEFADFLKQAIGFLIDLIPGVDGVREKFKQFSFADFFDKLYNMVADGLINFLNQMRDVVSDIGIGGILKNLGTMLYLAVQKMMSFPKAIAAGGVGALKNMFSDPIAGFQEAFQKKMNDESTRIDTLGKAMFVKADGRTEDGGYIKGLSEEGEMLRMRALAQDGAPISNESYTQVMQGGDTVIVGPSEPSNNGYLNFYSNTASD
jgi:hypothetical protein